MPRGVVKKWLGIRGFGFIESEEYDDDIFVHTSDVPGVTNLKEGQTVEFELEYSDRGPKAVRVSVVEE